MNTHPFYDKKEIQFPNSAQSEFEPFLPSTIEEWIGTGVLIEREKTKNDDVLRNRTIKANLATAIWDLRFVNEYCRDIPFYS